MERMLSNYGRWPRPRCGIGFRSTRFQGIEKGEVLEEICSTSQRAKSNCSTSSCTLASMAESSQASTITTLRADMPGSADQAGGPAPPNYSGEKEAKTQPGLPALNYDQEMDLSDEQELGAIRMEAVCESPDMPAIHPADEDADLVFGKGWKLWTLWG